MNEQKNKWNLIQEFLWKHWVVIFIAIVVLIPILLNWVIRWRSFFKFVGKDTDWLGFWVTYISAIASFAMVFITWRTLQQNKEQLEEIKRQWNEQNKPILSFKIIVLKDVFYLKVENTGKSSIVNAKLILGERALLILQKEGIDISCRKENILDDILNLGANDSQSYPLCIYRDVGNFDCFDIIAEYDNNAEYHKIDMKLPYKLSKINDDTKKTK